MMDAPWYIDYGLALVMSLAALVQYLWIARNGTSLGRWMMAIGWTGLAVRVVWGLVTEGNVAIHAASVPFLVSLAGGTVLVAWRQIIDVEPQVNCLQKPEYRCYREDRIRVKR